MTAAIISALELTFYSHVSVVQKNFLTEITQISKYDYPHSKPLAL